MYKDLTNITLGGFNQLRPTNKFLRGCLLRMGTDAVQQQLSEGEKPFIIVCRLFLFIVDTTVTQYLQPMLQLLN